MTVVGNQNEVRSMLTRLADFLKTKGITAMFTDLTSGDLTNREITGVDISSLMDKWLLLETIEVGGERNRVLYVLKSRGMGHSNQIREFQLTDHGFQLLDAYLGPEGVPTSDAARGGSHHPPSNPAKVKRSCAPGSLRRVSSPTQPPAISESIRLWCRNLPFPKPTG